jgi:hypothetical protein
MYKFKTEIIFNTIGAILGLVSGYLYYRFIGCENGCPIKSNPWLMTTYGGVMGGLLASLFFSVIKPKNK